MEQFDLVDINDKVIGTTDKSTAHRNKQLHRLVAVYVFNNSGELYVQVRKSSGLYDHSVGGHVKRGEDYTTAASREADEELGINQPLTHLANFYSDGGACPHMFGLFECVAEKTWQFIPNDEVEEIIPMTLDEIRELMKINPEKFIGGFVDTMREYSRIRGS